MASEERFGKYVLGARLGRGGMGVVHEAAAPDGTPVAIKRLTSHEDDATRMGVQRFLDEVKLGATLNHPNVVRTLDGGLHDGVPFLVMERLSGASLSSLFEVPGEGLEPSLALELVDQLLSALAYLHEKGVVHRDLKPSNIFITDDGVVKVIDFGIALAGSLDATATATGTIRGSIPFLAPEYLKGETPDPRSDLYAVGVVLHELLTGKRLFAQANHAALMSAILFSPVLPVRASRPEISAALDAVIAKVMSRERTARHASALELKSALRQFERSGPEALARWVKERRASQQQRTGEIPFAVATPFQPDPSLSGPVTVRRPSRFRWLMLAVIPAGALAGAGLFLALAPSSSPQDAGAQVSVPLVASSRPDAGSSEAPDAAMAVLLEPVPVDAGSPEARDAGLPVKVAAVPKRKSGFLTIDSQPSWSTISVDGRTVGPTPIFRRSLSSGEHRVEAVTADGRKKVKRVTVKPDAEVRVLFEW